MSYKISGYASESCKLFVINNDDYSIEHTTTVSGNFAIPNLLNSYKTVLGRKADGTCRVYGNVLPIYVQDYVHPATFGMQLVEQAITDNATYRAAVNFKWENNYMQLGSDQQGQAIGVYFFSCPKEAIDGFNVRFDVQQGISSIPDSSISFKVLDGAYDKDSLTDFPHTYDLAFTPKGAGELYNYTMYSYFVRQNIDTGILDLSSATFDDVTVMVVVRDPYTNQSCQLNTYGIEILDSEDTVKSQMETGGSVSWVYNSEQWTRGTYGSWNAFYD